MSTRLCAVCNGIFTGPLYKEKWMNHHRSAASLRRSAEEGCYICGHLVAVTMTEYNVLREDIKFRWFLSMDGYKGPRNRGPYTRLGDLRIESKQLCIVFELISTASSNAPVHSVHSGASLTDQAVMETARSWLENCRQNHAWCEPVDPNFNPTKLLYIHDASSVQLIETEKEAKSHAYVAFSHCWGKSETLKLLQDDEKTKGNIEELRSLIQVQRLPTSYREAISVSLALGFRHIWIDSLCIIQNSHDDSAKESAMMKDVYANSSLNLCASAAGDSSEASFQHRGRGYFVPLDVESQWTGIRYWYLKKSRIYPLPSYLHRIKFKLVHEGMYRSEISESPLNLRAWVMQERYLSRRHLFMTCSQLWWECRDTWASEAFPAGVPDSFDEEYEANRVLHRYTVNTYGHQSFHHGAVLDSSLVGQTDNATGGLAQRSPSEKPSEIDMDKLWHNLIRQYSQCDLSYSYDKLPALSGLVQIFSVARGPGFSLYENSYLAGIWRPHLPKALCWAPITVDDSYRYLRSYRPHPYRAPSWSWASVEGSISVTYHDKDAKLICRVVDAKVLPEDERYRAGTVKGGILRLESRLIGPFKCDNQYILTPLPPVDSRVRKAIDASTHWTVDVCWDENDTDYSKVISYLDPLPHNVREDGVIRGTDTVQKRFLANDSTDEPRIRLFIAPILIRPRWPRDLCPIEGLILCHVVSNPELEGIDKGVVFQRVGYFSNLKIEKEALDLVPERTIAII